MSKLVLSKSGNARELNQPPTANIEFLSELVQMGFDQQKSEVALIKTKNQSVDAAVDFILSHTNDQDYVLDSSSTNQQHQSNIYNPFEDSSSKLESTTTSNSTDSSTASTTFSSSTKNESLASGSPLIINSELKLKGDSESEKQAFKEKLRQEELERMRKEKLEQKKQLEKLRKQIEEEKRERMERFKPTQTNSTSSSSATTTTSQSSSSTSTDCTLQIRLPNGEQLKEVFPSQATLLQVADMITRKSTLPLDSFSLVISYPRREFTEDQFNSVSLVEAKLVPRGQLIVQETKAKGVIKKGEGSLPQRQSHHDPQDYNDDDNDGDDDDMGTTTSASGHRLGGPSRQQQTEEMEDDDDSSSAMEKMLTDGTGKWILMEDETKNANQVHPNHVILILRPAEVVQQMQQSGSNSIANRSASTGREEEFRFLTNGLLLHLYTDEQSHHTKTTSSLQYRCRVMTSGMGQQQRQLEVIDEHGSTHQVEVLVLTKQNCICKVPKQLFARLFSKFVK